MNAFIQTLRNLGPLRLGAIALVAFSLLGFFGFITSRISSSPMALLYNELDAQDAGAISQKLDAMKIPYEVAPNGGMIRVPGEQVGKVRMMMAAEGLPKGGSIGYEIFDQKEGFGTTSFVQNINHLRALEGELARTISTMGSIQSARVHLVLPQRELFSHGTQTATASVFLKTRSGAALAREQIASIQHLIAAAVPQLQPTQISIVDDKGNLLARPSDGGAGGGVGTDNQDELRAHYEQTQARKIEDLLARTLGFGKVRAQVSADLDFDRITTSSEIFDPESQVVRSQQSTTEDSSASDGGSGSVSITNNMPGGQAAGGGEGANKTNRAEETINYEINKTVRSQVRESGQVKRLSVAVVVDGTTTTAADGAKTYQPRTTEELDQIKTLVRSAVNYDATRGDTVEVINMPFTQGEGGETDATSSDLIMGMPKLDLLRIAETLLLAFIGLMVVLLVVRPILKRLFESAGNLGGDNRYLASDNGATAQLPPPAQGGAYAQSLQSEPEEDSEIEKMIDISRVEGRVKASSLRKVGEIVDKHPEEAVSILRNWIYQESR